MKTPRVAVYVRVSTQDQTCELQRRELLAHLEARGWALYEVFEDKATGTNGNRPMLKAMLQAARQRQFDTLICWKLDRLFRSLKDLVVTLQELTDLGIDFISLRDHIDLTTHTGRLMLHLLGAFAEFEASLIRSRVASGLANARAKGVRLGRPRTIDPANVLALRRAGFSLNEIALRLGVSKAAVHKVLSRASVTNSSTKAEILQKEETANVGHKSKV